MRKSDLEKSELSWDLFYLLLFSSRHLSNLIAHRKRVKSRVSGWGASQRRASALDLFISHVFSHLLEQHELL
jgi:hypothetical protein